MATRSTTKKRIGRPPLPRHERRSVTEKFRCTKEESELLWDAAIKSGGDLSTFVRGAALARAREVLEE